MKLTYRMELRPSPGQVRAMLQAAGNARWAYNWGLRRKIESYAATGKSPSAVDLHRELNALKKVPADEGGVPWMYAASKCAPQEALRNLDSAFKHFFRRVKLGERPGFPRFKKRSRGVGGFQLTGVIAVKSGGIQLPSLGKVRLMPGERGYAPLGKYSQATVRESAGRWYVTLLGEERPGSAPNGGPVVGLDAGVVVLATLSTGETIANPRALAASRRRLLRASRSLARKVKGSANRAKARAVLARAHRRVRNVRQDALHKATTRLTKNHGRIVIEDLKIKSMTKRGGSRKRGLNRVMQDASLSELRRQLEYKGRLYGCEIVAVPAAYTSQRCSSCGHVARENRKTQAAFVCVACGHAANADVNAAINILAAASWTEAQNACVRGRQTGTTPAALSKQESHGPAGRVSNGRRTAAGG